MAVASAGLYASLHAMQTTTPTSHHSGREISRPAFRAQCGDAWRLQGSTGRMALIPFVDKRSANLFNPSLARRAVPEHLDLSDELARYTNVQPALVSLTTTATTPV